MKGSPVRVRASALRDGPAAGVSSFQVSAGGAGRRRLCQQLVRLAVSVSWSGDRISTSMSVPRPDGRAAELFDLEDDLVAAQLAILGQAGQSASRGSMGPDATGRADPVTG